MPYKLKDSYLDGDGDGASMWNSGLNLLIEIHGEDATMENLTREYDVTMNELVNHAWFASLGDVSLERKKRALKERCDNQSAARRS